MKNYSRVIGRGLALAVWLAALVSMRTAVAHHSLAAFDLGRETTIRGAVVAFDWIKPHVRVLVDLAENADVRHEFEGMSPDYLGRRGWNRRTLQPGDLVEITCFPFRDGRPGGMLVRARLADGTVKVAIDTD